MLKTPETVLLVLRCFGSFLSLGEAGASEMAESTLLRSTFVSCTPAAMVACVSVWVVSCHEEREQQCDEVKWCSAV